MKLTPLLLFLLILVVLVIAVTTLKNPIGPSVEKEGFVQFKTNVVPQTETVVPPYSGRPIVKLYDNLFVDRQNINLVEVHSLEYKGNIDASYKTTGNVDLTGASITAINVQTRDGATTNYPVTSATVKESEESKISSIVSSYKSVPFYTSACATTAKYQLFYIPWGTDTYIHGIETTPTPSTPPSGVYMGNHIFTYRIPSDKSANLNAKIYSATPIDIIMSDLNIFSNPVPTTTTTDNDNNKMVTEPLYSASAKVYQLTPDIKYDVKNGNIIVNGDKSITVYDRSGKPTKFTSTPSTIESAMPNVEFNPWIVKNVTTKIQILYVQSGNNTIVALFKRDLSNRLSIVNMARFNANGIDDGTTTPTTPDTNPNPPPPPGPNVDPSAISDYYKWYWYWNSAGPGTNAQYSNNYLLKTQIVPPVCPSCPTATCASNAGSTGSSTGSSDKKSGNIVTSTVDTAGNVVNKTIDTTSNVLNKTIDTTSNLLTSGATGATNLLTSGVSGAANLLTSGATGATNLGQSGVTGTVALAKDAGSGVVKVADKTLKTAGNIVGDLTDGSGYGSGAGAYYGGLNTPYGSGSGYSAPGFSRGSSSADNYSYYGALPSKGSNYIPITADFSAFKK